jgi:uncharacterized membrane protein
MAVLVFQYMEPEQHNAPPAEMHPEPHHEKNTGMAVVAYIIFFVPLLTDAKNDPFVKYHVHQGFVLFLGWVALSIVSSMVWMLSILHLGLLVLMVLGIMNALHGKQEPLPLIGQFASRFHF